MLPAWQPLPLKMPAFRSGTAYTVKGRRLVTQSCSLLSVAHTLTHQGWNTCHDQHAASGSQNKLLTCGITVLTQVMLPQWARVGWGTMSSKVTRHAGKPKSPRCPCEEFLRRWGETRCWCQHLWSQTWVARLDEWGSLFSSNSSFHSKPFANQYFHCHDIWDPSVSRISGVTE